MATSRITVLTSALVVVIIACLCLPSTSAFSASVSSRRSYHNHNQKHNYEQRTRGILLRSSTSSNDILPRQSAISTTTVVPVLVVTQPKSPFNSDSNNSPHKLLIHWKGEDAEGYSHKFRHVEFCGALSAVLNERKHSNTNNNIKKDNIDIAATAMITIEAQFENALEYKGRETAEMNDLKIESYNQAMQFVTLQEQRGDDNGIGDDNDTAMRAAVIRATKRCSLIHALYEVVAETTSGSYDELNDLCLANGGFADLKVDHEKADEALSNLNDQVNNTSWSLRVRHFGEKEDEGKERRFGHRARSMAMERKALTSLDPLFSTFAGPVNLKQPDCRITVFDGLVHNTQVLARHVASGPKVSIMDPNTRICITNTPLCPLAAFAMCNAAQLGMHQTVLDPFAGSCAILMATAMIEPTCQTVGIELAKNDVVNRDDVRRDFTSRHLTEPIALLQGDSSDESLRAQARAALSRGGDGTDSQPFDAIITDPPYGIRESTGSFEDDGLRPIDELFNMIQVDRDAGTPLLKVGGRLVVFLPHHHEEESFVDIMPSDEQIARAGLYCELKREQPLNDVFSRWLVSFVCIE